MLKETVMRKIKAMEKEELLTLLFELCESNEDVIKYLNNTLFKTKLDAGKYINQIERCFEGYNFKVDKAMNIYITLRKTTKDYSALSKIGLALLSELLFDYDLGNPSMPRFKRIEIVSEWVCLDMSKAPNNKNYRKEYENLLSAGDEMTYEVLSEIYYGYFDSYLEDEE